MWFLDDWCARSRKWQKLNMVRKVKCWLKNLCVLSSAVVDKHFVNKIGNKIAISRKYDMSTKILICRHNNVKIKINVGSFYLAEEVNDCNFGICLEHPCIYFLTIVVDVGMKFDPTCRQRNLSSTTALVLSYWNRMSEWHLKVEILYLLKSIDK